MELYSINKTRVRNGALWLIACCCLTACSSIIPGATREPPQLYELSPKNTFAANLPTVKAQVLIEKPEASAGLQSSRIAIKQKQITLDYVADSEWTDIAPNLVQTLLIESFENVGKLAGIGREGTGLRTDFLIKTDLREFQAEVFKGRTSEVHIRLIVKLVRWDQRVIFASKSFFVRVQIPDTKIDSIVNGFDTALGRVLKQTVNWSVRTLAKEVRRRPISRY